MHVICPLEFERSRLAHAAKARGWVLYCCGPGRAGIERWAASMRLPAGTQVVLAGVAGGLRPSTIPGTAVVPSIIVDEHGREWHVPAHTGLGKAGAPPQRAVRCLSSEHVLQTPDAKRVAAERFDADLVDMESAAFARVAEAAGWNWQVIRGISDGYNETLPDGVEQWTSANGQTRIGAVLGSLARRPMRLPTLVPQLLALGRRSGAAMQAVEDALTERH